MRLIVGLTRSWLRCSSLTKLNVFQEQRSSHPPHSTPDTKHNQWATEGCTTLPSSGDTCGADKNQTSAEIYDQQSASNQVSPPHVSVEEHAKYATLGNT